MTVKILKTVCAKLYGTNVLIPWYLQSAQNILDLCVSIWCLETLSLILTADDRKKVFIGLQILHQ